MPGHVWLTAFIISTDEELQMQLEDLLYVIKVVPNNMCIYCIVYV